MLCFLDTETGGLTTDQSLLELALIITTDELEITDRLVMKLKPDDDVFHIHPRALEVNRIDIMDNYRNGISYAQGRATFREFMVPYSKNRPLPTIAGWNVQFDMRFLRMLVPEAGELFSYRLLDVQAVSTYLQLTKKVPQGLGSLESHIRYYGFASEQKHSAESDCLMTIAVLRRFLDAS